MSDALPPVQPASLTAAATLAASAIALPPLSPSPAAARVAPLIQAIDRQLHPDAGEYVGRAFLQDVITTFMQSTNRMLVFTGAPGVGKTAFAAQLVRERLTDPHPYLGHFCSLPDGDNPIAFCRSLAEQIKAYLGDDYQIGGLVGRQLNINQNVTVGQSGGATRVVAVEIKELKLGDIHPREAFRSLVREPLQSYHARHGGAPDGAPLMVVIDALDRVWQWDGGQSANIISVLTDVQDLPPWVNFICTARPGPAVQALRAQAGVRVWDIVAGGPENRADIVRYLRDQLVAPLDAAARARLDAALADSDLRDAQPSPVEALIAKVADASQGIFSYVRRYAGAWRLALRPAAGQPALEPSQLLRFDHASLDRVLNASYEAIYQQVRPTIDADTSDADEEVLATLALAFEPLSLKMLTHLSGWSGGSDALLASLTRLAPVLDVSGGEEATYAFYHRGFAEYVRRLRDRRERDIRIARLLEQGADDQRLYQYGAHHRWAHLLRGLNLAADTAADADPSRAQPASPQAVPNWRDGVARVSQIAPDAITQAQLLRLMAARALDPSEADVDGSWRAALSCLRAAVRILQRSRAIMRLDRRRWRLEGQPMPQEVAELEQTLIALGDAYRVIAQRMDVGGRQYDDWVATRRGLYVIWDSFVRLPLTLYLLLVLLTQGVREIHIPGALENLGRGQDWTIARLYVLSVSAYRRARALTRQRGSEDLEDDISERLARTYMMMGAYDAAASTYETLLARPAALSSPWRRAIWQHAHGEVLLARRNADRAAELLGDALLVFKTQEAPVLQARALSSLAAALALRASLADMRSDGLQALDLDDRVLVVAEEALVSWRDVTRLQGDEGASVDPLLAMSRVGNLLWRMTQTDRIPDEQVRTANRLRESIGVRIFPQRFEHPLLRLFRVMATILLPATLLLLLMLLVQSPNTFSIPTRTEPALQPPLVNLSLFPNNLVTGSAALPANLTNGEVTRLIIGSGLRQFAPEPPRISSSSFNLGVLTSVGVIGAGLLLVYLLVYTLVGLVIILIASPADHQMRRPGRLSLSQETLTWDGQVPLGVWRDSLRWAGQELATIRRSAQRRVLALVGREPAPAPAAQATHMVIPIAQVVRAVALDRRERSRLLGDFSLLQLVIEAPSHTKRDRPQQQVVSILGSLVFYDELCDELGRRLGDQMHRMTIEIIRSSSGLLFIATLAYTAILALIASLTPAWLIAPLPGLSYTLSDLYVVVAPGILVPLLWWFVIQPLSARALRGRADLALGATALVGGLIGYTILEGRDSANLLNLQPDFFAPTLAIWMLLAVALNLPRPLRDSISHLRGLVRILLSGVAFLTTALLIIQAGYALLWYDALVRGSLLIRNGLSNSACSHTGECQEFQRAIDLYTRMICLQPGVSKGYSFRGLARVAQADYRAAGEDFASAIRAAEGDPPPAPSGCRPGQAQRATLPADRAALHANLGAARILEAREQIGTVDSAEPLYQDALVQFVYALSLLERSSGGAGPATQLVGALPPPAPLTCASLVQSLIPASGVSPKDQNDYLLQIADACYTRGFNLARIEDRDIITNLGREEVAQVRRDAWEDLSAAVELYSVVGRSTDSPAEQIQADRGRAAAWFITGQITDLPSEAATGRTYLTRALSVYRDLARHDVQDEAIYAGQAWSLILIEAWSDAAEPLEAATRLSPESQTYPALQGLVAWLDSTRYPLPRTTAASPGYTNAIRRALDRYTRAIELSETPRSEAYATRSVLFYSLRNSPTGDSYANPDYGYWMRQAIADIDQAIVLASREGREPGDVVGYRYWRGRLSFTLALTWQRRLRGLHPWSELVPLYSQTLDDFSTAAAVDPQVSRRREYETLRIPWARTMLNNAVHMQLAEEAIAAGEYQTARRELELVQPTLTAEQRRSWDPLGEPRPELSLLHGLVALALDQPTDFSNPHTGQHRAEESFSQLISDGQRDELVNPEVRAAFFLHALERLDALVARGELTLSAEQAAGRARAQLVEALARTSEP